MSGSYDSGSPHDRRSYREPGSPETSLPQSAPGEASPIDRQALEQALQETLTAASTGGEIDPAEMEAIRSVSDRHKSPEITLDITADLIQSILSTHFSRLQAGASFWQTISREIARTLCEDPQTEDRLNTLWQRLQKEQA